MNKEEFEEFKGKSVDEENLFIDLSEIGDHHRTLLYGYTVERDSWHIYVRNGMVHKVVMGIRGSSPEKTIHQVTAGIFAHMAVPDKRVYPESTDLHFARLVISRGVDIPFTVFNEERHNTLKEYPFHGPVWSKELGPVWDRENGIEKVWNE